MSQHGLRTRVIWPLAQSSTSFQWNPETRCALPQRASPPAPSLRAQTGTCLPTNITLRNGGLLFAENFSSTCSLEVNEVFAHLGLLAENAKHGPSSQKTSTPHFAFEHNKSLTPPLMRNPPSPINLLGRGGDTGRVRIRNPGRLLHSL
jgi:hypothetical protein